MKKDFLDSATNILGPIAPAIRQRIFNYFDSPTAENWDDIHSILIDGKKHITIWRAVVELDPSFMNIAKDYRSEREPAKNKWKRWPDALLVARAIKTALVGSTHKSTRYT